MALRTFTRTRTRTRTRHPAPRLVAVAAFAALLGLAGCAYTPKVQLGQTAAEVEATNGPPTGRYGRGNLGSRLEYARGPFGRHTYMVDVSPEGRVTAFDQVLTEARFGGVLPGQPIEDVQLLLGRPSQQRAVGWRGDQLWSWRYEAVFCQWFVVTVMPDGRVRDAGYAPDPLCDADDRPDHGH